MKHLSTLVALAIATSGMTVFAAEAAKAVPTEKKAAVETQVAKKAKKPKKDEKGGEKKEEPTKG